MRCLALSLSGLLWLAMPSVGTAEGLNGTLAKIAKTGTITLGYREAEPPFSYKNADGAVVGFSNDLCQRIVEGVKRHLGLDKLTVEYMAATPATRFLLVKSGAIDLECAATTNNAERRAVVDFSYPHFMTATQFVSRKEDGIASLQDLSGRSVASTSGTVNIDQLNALNRDQNLNIAVMPTKENEDAFELVANGRASAFVMDGILLAAMIADAPDPSGFVLSRDTLSKPEPYGLVLRHGDEDFRTVVNATLREVFTSDEIETLYAKWFTSPIPPNNTNLNLPMSPALKAAFENPDDYLD